MQGPTYCRRLLLLAAFLAAWFAVCFQPTPAVEPTEQFLGSLRDRGLYELALDYLEQMRTSPLADKKFKQRIPYEQGVTLLMQSKRIGNTAERSAKIAEAKSEFDTFIQSNPKSDAALSAQMELAGALVGHGRAIRIHAEQLPSEKKADREKEMRLAQKAIEQGRLAYVEAKTEYRTIYNAFPKSINAQTDADQYQRRRETGQSWLRAWSLSLLAAFDEALTHSVRSKERKDLMAANAKDLAHLYDKYHRDFVGLNAHLYEGRCYQDMGKLKEAIGCYEEIAEQKAQAPEMRRLISKAIRYQSECYLAQKKYDEVIGRCEDWIKQARGDEPRYPDWLAVRYQLATAHQRKMLSTDNKIKAQRNRQEARRQFKFVVQQKSVFWKEAREQYATLISRKGEASAQTAKTFDEAFLLAKDAFEQMTAMQASLGAARDNAPDRVAEFEESIAANRKEAIHMLLLALPLANAQTDVDLLNQARAYLCYLHYLEGDYWRSAVLGEFLARKYPNHSMAKNSAKLAMSAYQRIVMLARQAGQPAESLAFEGRQMAQIADLITRRWPGTPDAADAFNGLIDFALREKRTDDARKYLEKVPDNLRSVAEMKVGSALWAEFVAATQLTPSNRPDAQQLESKKKEALRLLASGYERAKSDQVSSTLANAGLFLAQAYNREAQFDKAIDVLERETIGPLSLIEANHPSADRTGYLPAVYRTALQAYVLATPPRREVAERLMDALDRSFGDGPEAEKKLLQIYIGLGLQLQKQLASLHDTGSVDDVEGVAAAFEGFLNRVSDRIAGADWKSRLWLARAYYHLGQSVDSGGPLSPKAQAYYEKSLTAYNVLLGEKTSSGASPNPQSILAAKKQRADCFRRLRRYGEAIDGYAVLLAAKPMMLSVQQTAAETYQDWGDVDPSKYKNAIGGGHPNAKGDNIIYGWAKIARLAGRIAAKKPEYKDLYFKGWLQVARIRLAAALADKGAGRKKQLEKAKRSIRTMFQLYPDLGGPESYRQFNQVLRQIQQSLKQKATGLNEFE